MLRVNRIVIISALIICIVMLLHVPVSAQPTVTGVAGTLYHDSSVTISGSGFGTKSTAAPVIWDNFEWGSNNDALDTGSWTIEGSPGRGVISTAKNYTGTRSAYFEIDDGGNQFNNTFQAVTQSKELYMSYLYWVSNSGNCVHKLARMSANAVYSGEPYLKLQGFSSHKLYANWGNGSGGALYPGTPSFGAWHRIELYFRLSDPAGTANGEAIVGLDYNYDTDTNVNTRDTGDSSLLEYVMIGQSAAGEVTAHDVYLEDIYVDNTKQRVEVGDKATWNDCTHREIQISTAWSGNSITITVNQGLFAPCERAYLYVVDAEGQVSNPKEITFSPDERGTPCPPPDLVPERVEKSE